MKTHLWRVMLQSAPVLTAPDFSSPLKLTVVASDQLVPCCHKRMMKVCNIQFVFIILNIDCRGPK